jgi:glycerate kinase
MAGKRTTIRIGIAPDSFKGSLTALEAAERIAAGLRRACPGLQTVLVPMADGGEGTALTIAEATGGRMARRTVSDPLGRPVKAAFGLSGDGKTAVVEMAAASGLVLLKPRERNPMHTTTRGTGELMRAALKLGVRRLLVGIGGSATNDGGMGMARALGVRLLDGRGREVPEGGRGLARVRRIDLSRRLPALDTVTVEVACDVDNPLAGPRGAAQVYAPQKGASPAMVRELDDGLRNLAAVIRQDLGVDVLETPGAGAAGGLGAGLMAFCGGTLRPGIDMVIDAVGLERRLKGCDLVVTGEGRMDSQTVFGKTPAGVARVARRLGLPVLAICGSLGKGFEAVHDIGIAACFAALERPLTEEELPTEGPAMLERCAAQVGRLLLMNRSGRR